MRVLLISANTEQINMAVLPLGMACVAAAAENAGHIVETVNLMTQVDVSSLLENAIIAFSPEVIGISVRNIDNQYMEAPDFYLNSVKNVVSECRKSSNSPIVLGGAGYSIFPETALKYLGADMGIQGEGEAAFVQLLDRIHQKTDLAGLPGLYLPENDGLQKPTFTKNLDNFFIPLPNTHLSPHFGIKEDELWIPFQTRRGCPMDCSYCSTATIEGRIMRKFSPDKAVDALIRYVETGFNQFFFVDNTFNLPVSYAMEICDRIIDAKLNIRWRCIFYPWKAGDELIEKMARAGCTEVSFGFESSSEKILKLFHKRFRPDEVIIISETLKKHGIRQMGFLMLGGPGETMETVEKSLHFADSLQLESMKITLGIRIYPYTALAGVAMKEGIISSEAELLYPKFYMVNELKDRISETVNDWMKDRQHWRR